MARNDQRSGGTVKAKSNADILNKFKTGGGNTPLKPSGYGVRNTTPAPAPARPAPAPVSGGGGGWGGGGVDVGGGGGSIGPAALTDPGLGAAPAISEEDYLKGDASYQAQLAALLKAAKDYDAKRTTDITRYNTDFNEAKRNLGWMGGDATGEGDYNQAAGTWNIDDLNTASGRSVQGQQNDYGSRGLLQSSLFGEAKDNLMRSLNDQLTSTVKGRKDFLTDQAQQKASFTNENTLSQQQARAEALARRAASIGV